jgi:uncharacterized protein YcfL
MNNFFKSLSILSGLALVMAASSTLSAQSAWNLVHGHAKADIYEKTDVVCPNTAAGLDMQYTLLKIVNKTAQPVTVSYRLACFYDNQCRTCSNSEYDFSVTVPAGQTIEANCNFQRPEDGKLSVFQKYLNQVNYSDYTRYELQNLVIQ